MITLETVSVYGQAEERRFSGSVTFSSGLQVIHAPNGYGKSIIASAIGWCLGLEPMYGLQPGDNSLFSDGPRERLNLGSEKDVPVTTATAELVFKDHGGHTRRISRPITGSDPLYATVCEEKDGKRVPGTETRLFYGHGTMADETGGFHRQFFDWAALPVREILTYRGQKTLLYLENLAPLFFIEQVAGWRDLQAQQIVRYQQQGVREAALEYMLALDSRLDNRVQAQVAQSKEDDLRREGISLLETVNEFIRRNQWTELVSTTGSLSDLRKRIEGLSLREYLASNFNWQFETESAQLNRKLLGLRDSINSPDLKTVAPQSAISSRVIELKEGLQTLREQLSVLTAQLSSQETLLETLEARRKSAEDLLRLKKEKVGIINSTECPTCHHVIEPKEFDLTVQSEESIDRYIIVLGRDREALLKNIRAQKEELDRTARAITKSEGEYREAQQQQALLSQITAQDRESLVALSLNIAEVERAIEKNQQNKREVDDLSSRLQNWSTRVTETVEGTASARDSDAEAERLSLFQSEVTTFLRGLQHSSIDDGSSIVLDNDYVPMLRGRPLRVLGAASDRARLITAYVLALLDVSVRKHGHHPGFVVLDEPLQQNPDERRHGQFARFVSSDWKAIHGQSIILTSLTAEDIRLLTTGGVPIQQFETGRHFLSEQ